MKRAFSGKMVILEWLKKSNSFSGRRGAAVPAFSVTLSASPSPSRMSQPRPRLLLIEDEATISVALGRLLDRWGFDTVAARTVAEARAFLATVPVDLVVIDFRLPDVRGDDFVYWLQQEYPDLAKRSLFITGDYSDQALEAIEATKRPYLLKPFELGIFVHELRSLLDPLEGPRTNGRGAAHPRTDISAA